MIVTIGTPEERIHALEQEVNRLRTRVKVLMNQSSTRRALESLLHQRSYTVYELAEKLGTDRTVIYRHFRKLGALRDGTNERGHALWRM